jgi:plastocyanin
VKTGPGRFADARRASRAALIALACLPLATCLAQLPAAQDAVPSAPSPAPAPAPAQIIEIAIRDYSFQPAELKIVVGTTVRWTNQEKRVSHSVLFTGGGGFESERMFPGESWQRRFDEPGVFLYTCGPHPEMHGRIEVAAQ